MTMEVKKLGSRTVSDCAAIQVQLKQFETAKGFFINLACRHDINESEPLLWLPVLHIL
jgi:hypothetical protein